MNKNVGNLEVFITKDADALSCGFDKVKVKLTLLNRYSYENKSADTIIPRHIVKFENIPLGHYDMEVSCKGYLIKKDYVHVKFSGPDTHWKGHFRKSRNIKYLSISEQILFPFERKKNGSMDAVHSYQSGMGAFGAIRSSGKRRHAGCDLYAPKGTPIIAIKNGLVIQEYPFYMNTRALEIDHGNMIVRYCEIANVASGLKQGDQVKQGQIIAYVGELKFSNGNIMSMLHIEFYKGTLNGPLTARGAMPYQRRADLFDPTTLLDTAAFK